MDKIVTFALAMAVSLGTTAMLANGGHATRARAQMVRWLPMGHSGTGCTLAGWPQRAVGRCIRRSGGGRANAIALRSPRDIGVGTTTFSSSLWRAGSGGLSEGEGTESARIVAKTLGECARDSSLRLKNGDVRNDARWCCMEVK